MIRERSAQKAAFADALLQEEAAGGGLYEAQESPPPAPLLEEALRCGLGELYAEGGVEGGRSAVNVDGGVGIAGGCPKRRGGSDAADAAGDAGAADAASAADAVGSADAFAALDDLLARSDAPGEDEKGLSGTQQLSATAPPSAGGVCKGGLYWYEGEDFSRRGADPHGGGSQSDERDREAYAQLLRRQPGGRAGGGEEGEADGSVGRKRRRQMSAEVKLLIWNTHFPAHVFPRCQTQMSDPDARPRCQTQMSDPPPYVSFPVPPRHHPDVILSSHLPDLARRRSRWSSVSGRRRRRRPR